MSGTTLSILLCTRGVPGTTVRQGITSAAKELCSSAELVVVDQNPAPGIEPEIEAARVFHPSATIKYFRQNATGLSRARNFALSQSLGDWVILFDDDAVFEDGVVSKICQKLASLGSSGADSFYGEVFNLEDRNPYIKRKIRTRELQLWNFDSACSVELILNRKAVEAAGGFDESFGAGSTYPAGEEADLVIRMLRKGFPIRRMADYILYHPRSEAPASKRYAYGMGLGALYRKHISGSGKQWLAAKAVAELGGRAMLGVLGQGAGHRAYLRGFLKGFLGYSG